MDAIDKSQKDHDADEKKNEKINGETSTETIQNDIVDPYALVTTRSMSAQLKSVLNDPQDDSYDLKRKIFEHKENVYNFFDTANLVKKVKLNNEERHENEPIKLYYQSEEIKKSPEKSPEKQIIEEINKTKPVKIKIVQGKSNFEKKTEEVFEELESIEQPIEETTPKKNISYYESDSDQFEDGDSDYEKEQPLVGLFEDKKPSPFAEVKEIDENSELQSDEKDVPIKGGGIEVENISEYQSIIEKKPKKKEIIPKVKDTFENYSVAHIKRALGKSADKHKIKQYKQGTYINCDVRYFNFASLGDFDVVLIDPPWRVLGGQRHGDSANMFSNNNFKLNYQTLSNEEIIDLDVESLSQSGFCFLWVTNSHLQFGLQCLNKWGYSYVDKITWVKKSKSNSTTIYVSTGYYLLHSVEICLIGVKHSTKTSKLQFISKVSNDIIFGKVGMQSRKPEEQYQLIEAMVPGGRKVEVFARNHNIRSGWLSLGNRLGPAFDQKVWVFVCHLCAEAIEDGNARYKHKKEVGKDTCHKCIEKLDKNDFFQFDNNLEETVYHDWFTCDKCGQYPICGVRFSCTTCEEFDVCEACFEVEVLLNKTHDEKHVFEALEVPAHGAGFPVHHRIRCNGCLVCPIIGERVRCLICPDINLCRNCFFKQKEMKTHEKNHEMELIPEAESMKTQKCFNCKNQTEGALFSCKTCSNLLLCEACYDDRINLEFEYMPSHKNFHKFTKIN